MVKYVKRKSLAIRPNGRSSDYIAPAFGFGCLYDCTYCYMKRYKSEGIDIAANTEEILTTINSHTIFQDKATKPNQTDEKYVTYDIGCNEDFALHGRFHNWRRIFKFFKDHPIAKATFATKYIPEQFLSFNPEGKVRIRFSLMPQEMSSILEPNTTLITDRINAVNFFIEAGYDVHLNFSPVIYYKHWLKGYRDLFKEIDKAINNEYKNKVKCEVIFLTHNAKKHEYNCQNNLPGEGYLWKPFMQEPKVSEYGGHNIRYKAILKRRMITKFKENHNNIIPWNTIRYIF